MSENPAGGLFVWGEIEKDKADSNRRRDYSTKSAIWIAETGGRRRTVYRRKPEDDSMQGFCSQGANHTQNTQNDYG